MDGVEVLVLHGSPGSGKSTLAREISEILRTSDIAHAVIDLDELSLVFPSPARSFAYDNLAAIWPNYVACGPLKVLMPSVIADAAERERLRVCVPGARFAVCELTAAAEILKHRVTAREPNEHWRRTLRDFVDLYADGPIWRESETSRSTRVINRCTHPPGRSFDNSVGVRPSPGSVQRERARLWCAATRTASSSTP